MPQQDKISVQKKQGWINYYRKPFLLTGILLVAGLSFFSTPLPYFQISAQTAIYLEETGIILFFLGVIGRIFSSVSIASYKNQKVINTELYSIVRNPLYVSSLLIVLGVTMFLPRIDVAIAIILLFILCFYPIILNEEKFLAEKFGQDYLDYKKSVPRIIPNPFKWNNRATMNVDFILLSKTFLDTMAILVIIIIIKLIQIFF